MKIKKIIVLMMLPAVFINIHGKNDASNFLELLIPLDKKQLSENISEFQQEPVEEKDDDISFKLLSILVGGAPNLDNYVSADRSKLFKGGIEHLGIEYLDYNRYYNEAVKMPVIEEKDLPLVDRMNLKKYGWLTKQKYEAPWYAKFVSEKVGHGIFAATDLQEGDFIGEYTGIVYDNEAFLSIALDSNCIWSILPPANFSKKTSPFYVDAKKFGNFTRFINHSSKPNAKPVIIYAQDGWHMIYVAAQSIKKDEQILVDYGVNYWHGYTPEEL